MTATSYPRARPELGGVIFDLDGVIVDSHPVHRKAWHQFCQSLGLDVSDGDLDFVLDGRKRCYILRHFLGDLSEPELENYGQIKDSIVQSMQLEIAPIPGVLRLLRELADRGIALAVVTSASRSRTFVTLGQLGVKELFSVVITGEDVIAGKPDPAGYQMALDRLRETPEPVIAVEDAVSGVQAATRAGLRCLGVAGHQSRESLVAAGAVAVARDFTDISIQDVIRMCRSPEAFSTSDGVAS
jgi:HAD superfamily hydrolase (TIGR01509 family)